MADKAVDSSGTAETAPKVSLEKTGGTKQQIEAKTGSEAVVSSKKRLLEDSEYSESISMKEMRTKSPEPFVVAENGGSSENNSVVPSNEPLTPAEIIEKLKNGDEIRSLDLDEAIALEGALWDNNEEEDEADVAAVLGDCSDTECSYKDGYKKRQALYSCLTCFEKSKEVAGICLACTYSCHDGHTFVEMYTKRNFRCDCGNSKFSGLACKLIPKKDILNEKNQYNQNFNNIYCVCKRPHPDPEQEELVQVQCELCEDWFHLEHALKMKNEDIEKQLEEFRTLICKECRVKHPFVNYYIAEEGDENFEFDKEVHKIDGCALEFLKNKFPALPEVDQGGWTGMDWHENICRCAKCADLYKAEKVEFLLDPEDSFHTYSEKGVLKQEQNKLNSEASAMQEIMSSLGRYGQIEFASAFAEMRTGLEEMIRKVASEGGEITAEVVQEFFAKETEKLNKRKEAILRGGSDFGSGSSGSSS